jgi:hypothetical protein
VIPALRGTLGYNIVVEAWSEEGKMCVCVVCSNQKKKKRLSGKMICMLILKGSLKNNFSSLLSAVPETHT